MYCRLRLLMQVSMCWARRIHPYYVFKGAALINKVANINKNNVYVDWVNPNVVQNMKTMTAEALFIRIALITS